MKDFVSIKNKNIDFLIKEAIEIKKNPVQFNSLGQHKTLGMLFYNPSLRTRLSTQKAAYNLGMNVMVMNFTNEGWDLEFEDGTIMNSDKAEHVKEAAQVLSQYCDIIAIRSFASLTNKKNDENEVVINAFKKYATVPILNMESATEHPLQAITDAITITEVKKVTKPKVVLTWAPHPKALPHAVANSFTEIMQTQDVDFVITHPKGYELNPSITKSVKIEYNQDKAFEKADFIYAKNWSSYNKYGKVLTESSKWMVTKAKMKLTNKAKFMHCLPVRRNVVVADDVLDSKNSITIQQAQNRTFAAQAVLKNILENG